MLSAIYFLYWFEENLISQRPFFFFLAMYTLTNFINEDDRGLELDGQGEDGCSQFLGLSIPFIRQSGGLEVDEPETRLFCCGFGYEGFSTARGTVQ